MNGRASTRAQTWLFLASYVIYDENVLFVLEAWNPVPDSILA